MAGKVSGLSYFPETGVRIERAASRGVGTLVYQKLVINYQVFENTETLLEKPFVNYDPLILTSWSAGLEII